MGLIDKIKLLFKIQKPLGEVAKAAKEVRTGWKTLKFWITLLGTLASTAGALTGFIPAQAQLIISTVLQTVYNVLRGAEKMESVEVKGTLTTTEFWMSGLTEVQKALVTFETGGVNPAWMTSLSAFVAASLAFGQNLAARQPTIVVEANKKTIDKA